MTDAEKMQVAIEQAKAGARAGNDPYGAAIFDGDVLLAAAHNCVASGGDPVAHAEIQAVRAVYTEIAPEVLARSVLYASCEPCPMCAAAIGWAGIGAVVYASLDAGYGGMASAAPSLPRPRAGHLPTAEADALQEAAKAGWQNRDPRRTGGGRSLAARQGPARGSCLCGAIRYEVGAEFTEMHHCHCERCRKAHGAAFSTFARAAAAAVHVVAGAAHLREFRSSPSVRRSFCADCGSSLFFHFDPLPEAVWVAVGTLDDDPGLRPQGHIFVASKADWHVINDVLPQFAEYPPQE